MHDFVDALLTGSINAADADPAAKEHLSEAPSATITLDTGTGRHTLTVTRGEFDELIGPDLDRAVALARATLADAGVTAPSDLAALYLTGGSTRIPLVHTRLGELGPVATLDDPKTVVSRGALLAVEDIPGPGGLVAVAGIAVTVMRGLCADNVAAAGAIPSAQCAADNVSGTATGLDSADPRNATTLRPDPLAGQLVNCKATGFSTKDVLEVSCDIPEDSVLASDRVRPENGYDALSLTITAVDRTTALQNILSIRSHTDPAHVRENATRTAALDVSGFAQRSSYMASLANADLGLILDTYNARNPEAAEAFVRDSGLFG